MGRMQKGRIRYARTDIWAYNCRGESHTPNIVFAPMQCINIHGKIHGILSSVSHPGMKHLAVYRQLQWW